MPSNITQQGTPQGREEAPKFALGTE